MLIITNASVRSNIKDTFEYVVPIRLSHIFRKYKFLPAVTATDEKETWIKAGLNRTVFFSDGNSAKEYLKTVKSPEHFDYTVSNFTSPLKFLILSIEGNWQFKESKNMTNITWEYKLNAKNWFADLILKTLLKKDMEIYLQNAMDIIVADLEASYNS